MTVTIGDNECSESKLLHIREVKTENGIRWELQVFRVQRGNVKRLEAIEVDFLTRINNFEQKSVITYMTTWSNQLYISDAGKVY